MLAGITYLIARKQAPSVGRRVMRALERFGEAAVLALSTLVAIALMAFFALWLWPTAAAAALVLTGKICAELARRSRQ